jgi:hypothetical protein
MLAGYGQQAAPVESGDQLQKTFGIMRSEMVSTMRDLKDTLSLSMSTMNQTLSSVHETLRSINLHVAAYAQQRNPQYIPAPATSFYPGGLSSPMQNYLGRSSFMDLVINDRPFNVDPREFYTGSMQERDRRISSAMTDATFTGLQGAAVIGGSSLMERGAAGLMARRGLPLPGWARMGVGIAGSIALGSAMQTFNWGEEAAAFARNSADIRRLSPRTGREFSEGESMNVAQHLRRFALEETKTTTAFDTRLGQRGAESLLKQGMSSGLFNADNPDQLLKQFEQAAGVVRILTGIMGNKDIIDTVNDMVTLKAMGKNLVASPHELKQLNDQSFKYAAAMGVQRSQLVKEAMHGAQQIYPQFGLPSYLGITPMMQSMAYANELEKRRLLSPSEMSVAGGVKGLAQNITQFMAGMSRNPALGGLVYGAGMTSNGQFSMDQAQSAMNKGGYFGTAHSSIQNIISGGPSRYLLMQMESPNMEDAMSSSGQKGEMMREMLKKAIAMSFQALRPKTYMERLAVAAAAIQDIGQQQGTPVDMPTAKALALQLISPQVMNAMEKEGTRAMSRGDFDAIAARNTPGRMFSRIGEKWDTFTEGVSYYKDAAPAQGVYSWFNNLVNSENRADRVSGLDAGSRPMLSEHILQNAAALKPVTGHQNLFRGSVSPDEINAGFWGAGDHVVSQYEIMNFGANKNMITAMQIMAGQEWKDYYGRMSDPSKKGGNVADAYFAMKDSAGFGSIGSMMSDFKDSKYFNKLGGGYHWAMSKMHSKESIDKAASELLDRFSSLDGMKGTAKMDALAASRGFKEGTTPEAVMAGLTGTSEIKEFAKANNITERQAAYLYASRRYGGDMSSAYKAYALGEEDQKQAEKIGEALEGSTYSSSTLEHLKRISGVTMDTTLAGARELLGDIGMTEGIDKLVTGQSPESLRSFNKAMGMIVTGEHTTNEAEFRKHYDSLKGNKALQNQLSDIMQREKENTTRFSKYRKGPSYTDPVTGIVVDGGGGAYTSDDIAATLEGAQSYMATSGVRNTMSRLWGLTEKQANEFLKTASAGADKEGLKISSVMDAFKSTYNQVDKSDFSKNNMFLESSRVMDEAVKAFGFKGEGSLSGKKVSQLTADQKRALNDINPALFKQITQDTEMSQEKALKMYFNTALSAGMSDAGAKELNKNLKVEDALEVSGNGGKPSLRVHLTNSTKAEEVNKQPGLNFSDVSKSAGGSKLHPAGPGSANVDWF